MPDCKRCRYVAGDHVSGNVVCMYMGPEECSFEDIGEKEGQMVILEAGREKNED